MGIAYPASLPQSPQRAGFKHTQVKNVIRSTVDIGEAKMRKRYTLPIFNESWSLQLSPTQVTEFVRWFTDDISSGVLRFDFEDPITGVTEEYRITEMYTLTPYGQCGYYMASFPVEKLV